MASFLISTATSAGQTLAADEYGTVTASGAIAAWGDAITATGFTRLNIAGDVAGFYGRGIYENPAGFSYITIGSSGEVHSLTDIAIKLYNLTATASISNAGLVEGKMGVDVTRASPAGTVLVDNSGTIRGRHYAVLVEDGSGMVKISNSGRMAGQSVPVPKFIADLEVPGDIVPTIKVDGTGPVEITNSGEILAMSGNGAIQTGAGDDYIFNAGLIHGWVDLGNGNDSFTSRGGIVTHEVRGGAGNDIYDIDDADILLVENAGEGNDTVISRAVSFTLGANFEELQLAGAAIEGHGNGAANKITGNDRANILTGMAGNDTILGGGGNDLLGGGAGGDSLAGDDGDDSLAGDGGNDTLAGGDGDDLLRGGGGHDSLSGGNGDDTIAGGTGNDRLWGGEGDDWLNGNGGSDSLWGGNGDDTLAGGAGADTLEGGGGADRFVFLAVADSTPADPDLITDFRRGTDRIDLAVIDANTATAGDQAFAFIGTAAFSAPGQLRYSVVGGEVVVEMNTTGNTGAEMALRLADIATLAATDFIL